MSSLGSLSVVVAGGSIGGLCAGNALHRAGARVDIYERSRGPLDTRGAGIVVQPQLLALLQRCGAPALPTTTCRGRRQLSADGGDGFLEEMPQSFTSWESIYQTLRAAFPIERYHSGHTLRTFEETGGWVAAYIDGRGRVEANLLVCADGAQSETRRRLLPEVRTGYAGYVAWRGTVGEGLAGPDLADFFDGTFTFSDARSGGHMLVYFIPGPNGDTRPGYRVINWVWYVHAGSGELPRLLTGRDGREHRHSLPPGAATHGALAELLARARREVHPRMAQLIEATAEPFLQPIFDVVVPRTVFGRACLLGDAAFVVRPHTAGATAKAAHDSMLLADSLEAASGDVPKALAAFQREQIRYGTELHQYGVELGQRWARQR